VSNGLIASICFDSLRTGKRETHPLLFDLASFETPLCVLAQFKLHGAQNSASRGARGKGITSRMFAMPVTYMSRRSKPKPKPACGTVP